MIKCHHNRIQMQQDQRPVRVTRDMRNLGTEKRQQYQMQNTKKNQSKTRIKNTCEKEIYVGWNTTTFTVLYNLSVSTRPCDSNDES